MFHFLKDFDFKLDAFDQPGVKLAVQDGFDRDPFICFLNRRLDLIGVVRMGNDYFVEGAIDSGERAMADIIVDGIVFQEAAVVVQRVVSRWRIVHRGQSEKFATSRKRVRLILVSGSLMEAGVRAAGILVREQSRIL